MISFAFHALLVLVLFYFAAREGLLGKKLNKIAVQMDQGKAAGETQGTAEGRAAEDVKRPKLSKRQK